MLRNAFGSDVEVWLEDPAFVEGQTSFLAPQFEGVSFARHAASSPSQEVVDVISGPVSECLAAKCPHKLSATGWDRETSYARRGRR